MGTHVKVKMKDGVEKKLYKPLAQDLERRKLCEILEEIPSRRELAEQALKEKEAKTPRAKKVTPKSNKVEKATLSNK